MRIPSRSKCWLRTRYTRIDAPAAPEQKARLRKLSPEDVKEEAIDGLKIVTASGWFAARPSAENLYKIYAETFMSAAHLNALVTEAQDLVDTAIGDRA